jgi:hypothetical protein
VRITAPPIRWPCFLGIDIPDPDELIAHGADVEGVRQRIGAESLEFLSLQNLGAAIGSRADRLCLGCFTRDYPIDVQLPLDKLALERSVGLEMAQVFPRDSAVAGAAAGDEARLPIAVEAEARQPIAAATTRPDDLIEAVPAEVPS